jgi:hypothetical protein
MAAPSQSFETCETSESSRIRLSRFDCSIVGVPAISAKRKIPAGPGLQGDFPERYEKRAGELVEVPIAANIWPAKCAGWRGLPPGRNWGRGREQPAVADPAIREFGRMLKNAMPQ